MIKELKAFLFRGNVIELAVALVIGLAFTAIITAFVEGIINPLIALIVGENSISEAVVMISGTQFLVGSVVGAIVNFVLVGIVLFFLVKAANRLMPPKQEEVAVVETPEETILLREIRDSLRARNL